MLAVLFFGSQFLGGVPWCWCYMIDTRLFPSVPADAVIGVIGGWGSHTILYLRTDAMCFFGDGMGGWTFSRDFVTRHSLRAILLLDLGFC